MTPLLPDNIFVQNITDMVTDASTEYVKFLDSNNDIDDLDELEEILTAHTEAEELPLTWIMGRPGNLAIDWYIQNAIVDYDGRISIMLDPDSICGHWGPESFKNVVEKTIQHESIHLVQRDRMGHKNYESIPSGYQKGLLVDSKREFLKLYFMDPHELQAHGHDLAREILALKPIALKNPEKYRDRLPTYDKHRKVFSPNAKPLQRLLKYAYNYVEYYNAS